MLCRERRVEPWSLSARNVGKSGSDQQGAGSSVGEWGVYVAACNRSCWGHHCKGWMTVRWRLAWAGFELGSPDYQEKVLSTTLVRDHQLRVIWFELYVAVRHRTVHVQCLYISWYVTVNKPVLSYLSLCLLPQTYGSYVGGSFVVSYYICLMPSTILF